MSLEQQIVDLVTATTSLTEAVNVKKQALDEAVIDVQTAAGLTLDAQADIQTTWQGKPEAPEDGSYYIRKNAQWFKLLAGTNIVFDESVEGVLTVEAETAAPYVEPIKVVADATYTPVLTDAGKYLRFTSTGSSVLTVPANSSEAFPIGTDIAVEQGNTGAVSLVADAGVTINVASGFDLKTGGQFGVISLKKVATDEWTLFGNLGVL